MVALFDFVSKVTLLASGIRLVRVPRAVRKFMHVPSFLPFLPGISAECLRFVSNIAALWSRHGDSDATRHVDVRGHEQYKIRCGTDAARMRRVLLSRSLRRKL